jgi:ADP-ribose pyrophosphatase
MNDKIKKEEVVFDDFFKIYKADVAYDSFYNDNQINVTRLSLERGDAVAVLLHELDTDSLLFTEQYRYPAKRRDQPWSLELPAGAIDEGEKPEEAAKREVLEEIGYKVKSLEKIVTYFPSPGVSSEQITILFGKVKTADKVDEEGGVESENEDIKLVKLKKNQARQMLREGKINNSISIVGLQWFFLEKKE